MPSSRDDYCLPPSLGKEEKSLSGNVNIKGLDRKAYSQAVLSLLDKANCLERLWVGLFKGTVDPQPTRCTCESPRLKRSETSDLSVAGRNGVQASPTPGKHECVSEVQRCTQWCWPQEGGTDEQSYIWLSPRAALHFGAVSVSRQGSPSWHQASPPKTQW